MTDELVEQDCADAKAPIKIRHISLTQDRCERDNMSSYPMQVYFTRGTV